MKGRRFALAACLRWIAPLVWLGTCLAAPQSAPAETAALDLPSAVRGCETMALSRWRPPVGRHLAAMPLLPRPDKGVPHIDRVHGSCILRVTDHAREAPRGFARNDYSRRQSFNADESRLLVVAQDGQWHVYDARTLAHLAALPELGADAEPQWHPRHPGRLYYLPRQGSGMRLLELDLPSGHTRVVADFSSRVKRLWPTARSVGTGGQGSPSANGRYWAFLVDDASRHGLGLITWDLEEDRLIASYDLARNRRDRPEHLTMSLSGQHVVVAWPEGPVAFSRDFIQPRPLQGKAEQSDVALTPEGDDAYVSIDPTSPGSPLFMSNLRTGERSDLFATYQNGTVTALHVSGRAHRRPGWVLVSTYADHGKGGRQWLHRRVMAVELKRSPRIVHLAFHRSRHGKYWSIPHASVNRDFTRVLFNSNWGGTGDTGVDTYMVVLRRDALVPAHARR